MKLLVVTQALDLDDPVLGFFHQWLEAFSHTFEQVHVICLREGIHALPGNVIAHTLGKEKDLEKNTTLYGSTFNRMRYALRFLRLSWELHKEYDAVFVHMNPEYLALSGGFWKLAKKPVGLWYTHKSVDLKLRIAEFFADIIFTASKESFRLSSKKVQVMGHGIDTDFWQPDARVARSSDWLSVGRLMPSKGHDRAIRAAQEKGVVLRIAGTGPQQERLEAIVSELGARVVFLGACTPKTLRDEYRRAALLVHRSETGSLDKVVLEAALCGCPVDSTDPAISALPLSPEYVRTQHSLGALIPRIRDAYDAL